MKKFLSKILIICQSFVFLLYFSVNLDAQNPQWIIYNTTNSGLPSNHTSDIVLDSNNVKWIGTDSGLVKFFNQQWTVYNTNNSGLPVNIIYKLAVDRQNNIWIGTIGHGLVKFDGLNWTKYDTINSLGIIIVDVMGIQADSLNNLWICNNNGLLKFSNNNWTLYNTINSGLPSNFTTDIKIENNVKWIGTVWHGLVKYDDINWVVYNTTNSGLPMNFVLSIFIDNYKNKWIGTYMGGAARFNSQNNIWTLYNTVWPGLPGNDIRSIFVENNQTKWFGIAGAGIVKYNDTIIILYGYPLTYVDLTGKITSDKFNNIWMATDNQLAVYNPQGVIGINQNSSIVPSTYKLYQNYPNPFNNQTKIRFEIPKYSEVRILVFDVLGRERDMILDGIYQAGKYEIIYSPNELNSGIYFYRMEVNGEITKTKKLIFQK